MTSTVLFAYDGTNAARHAIDQTARLLGPGRLAVVVHVDPPRIAEPVPIAGAGVPVLPYAMVEEKAADRRDAILEEGCAAAEAAGFQVLPHHARASGPAAVADAIVSAADEHDASLIAVGGSERSRLLAVLFGSVGDSLVHRSTRPVLVVPSTDDE